MKKLDALFLFLMIALIPATHGQQAFAPLNAVWNYSYQTDQYVGYTLQKVTGDTTIAGKDCRKVVSTTYRYGLSTPTVLVDSVEASQYLNRSGDTVLYYNAHFSRFLPLYIFNVAVGDTLVYHVPYLLSSAPNDTLFRIVVDSIRTVTVAGVPLKRIYNTGLDGWYFYGTRSRSYTQLLGTDEGLVTHSTGTSIAIFVPSVIRCYRDNVINYVGEPGAVCEGANGIAYVQNSMAVVDIYPIPARDVLYVKMKDRSDLIQSVYLTDLAGRQIPCRRSLKSRQEEELYLGSLASGIYFIHVRIQDKQLVRKITVY